MSENDQLPEEIHRLLSSRIEFYCNLKLLEKSKSSGRGGKVKEEERNSTGASRLRFREEPLAAANMQVSAAQAQAQELNLVRTSGYENVKRLLSHTVHSFALCQSKIMRREGGSGGGKAASSSFIKGTLLYGPPGCGKTLLAMEFCQLYKLEMINVKISEIIMGYVGDSEKAVSQLFLNAKERSLALSAAENAFYNSSHPSSSTDSSSSSPPPPPFKARVCIFMDEIDAMFSSSQEEEGKKGGGTSKLCSQLTSELDALKVSDGVILLAATNLIDTMRRRSGGGILVSGRIDRLLYVGLPSEEDRIEILRDRIMKSGVQFDDDLLSEEVLRELSMRCEGMPCAMINEVIRRALLLCVSRRTLSVLASDDSTSLPLPFLTLDDLLAGLKEMGKT